LLRSNAILAPMSVASLVTFCGEVECRFDGCGPLGLILSGHTTQRPEEVVHLAFAGAAPADFPRTLDNATIEPPSAQSYRISSGARSWTVNARAAHLHREVAAAFYQAVPTPPVRWTQRLFWRIVLALAASAAGRWLLRTVRGA
jgi:hypothetical protein